MYQVFEDDLVRLLTSLLAALLPRSARGAVIASTVRKPTTYDLFCDCLRTCSARMCGGKHGRGSNDEREYPRSTELPQRPMGWRQRRAMHGATASFAVVAKRSDAFTSGSPINRGRNCNDMEMTVYSHLRAACTALYSCSKIQTCLYCARQSKVWRSVSVLPLMARWLPGSESSHTCGHRGT